MRNKSTPKNASLILLHLALCNQFQIKFSRGTLTLMARIKNKINHTKLFSSIKNIFIEMGEKLNVKEYTTFTQVTCSEEVTKSICATQQMCLAIQQNNLDIESIQFYIKIILSHFYSMELYFY